MHGNKWLLRWNTLNYSRFWKMYNLNSLDNWWSYYESLSHSEYCCRLSTSSSENDWTYEQRVDFHPNTILPQALPVLKSEQFHSWSPQVSSAWCFSGRIRSASRHREQQEKLIRLFWTFHFPVYMQLHLPYWNEIWQKTKLSPKRHDRTVQSPSDTDKKAGSNQYPITWVIINSEGNVCSPYSVCESGLLLYNMLGHIHPRPPTKLGTPLKTVPKWSWLFILGCAAVTLACDLTHCMSNRVLIWLNPALNKTLTGGGMTHDNFSWESLGKVKDDCDNTCDTRRVIRICKGTSTQGTKQLLSEENKLRTLPAQTAYRQRAGEHSKALNII